MPSKHKDPLLNDGNGGVRRWKDAVNSDRHVQTVEIDTTLGRLLGLVDGQRVSPILKLQATTTYLADYDS